MNIATRVRFVPNTQISDIIPVYLRYASPRFLIGYVALALAARIWAGQWSWWDLAIAAGIVAAQPFTEWLIHTFILHDRPHIIAGRTVDLHLAKEHRRHHRDPKDIQAVFIPFRTLVVATPIGVALAILMIPSLPMALTVVLTFAAIINVYEWTHFYVHSGCRPKNAYARYIERAHRLHHYRNEHYWMGVTVHAADHVLGTFPDRDDVPVSETARTLGIETA